MKKVYKKKRDLLILQLKKNFGSTVRIIGHESGLHFLVEFPKDTFNKSVRENLNKSKLNIGFLDNYYFDTTKDLPVPCLVLGFANNTDDDICRGIQLLRRIIMNKE